MWRSPSAFRGEHQFHKKHCECSSCSISPSSKCGILPTAGELRGGSWETLEATSLPHPSEGSTLRPGWGSRFQSDPAVSTESGLLYTAPGLEPGTPMAYENLLFLLFSLISTFPNPFPTQLASLLASEPLGHLGTWKRLLLCCPIWVWTLHPLLTDEQSSSS